MFFSCLCESCLINDTRGYVITIGNYKDRIQDNVYVKSVLSVSLRKRAFTLSIRDFGLNARAVAALNPALTSQTDANFFINLA
jgi:hypothetical protein